MSGQVLFNGEVLEASMSRYLVIGTGITGATVANLLARDSDSSVIVIDRRAYLGGNCADRHIAGINVHLHGSHIIHTDNDDVWRYLQQFTGIFGYIHKVNASVREMLINLPFGFDGIRRLFSDADAERIISDLSKQYDFGEEIVICDFLAENSVLTSDVIDAVYREIFFGYTVKQWGVKPEDVDPSVLSRVPIVIGDRSGYFSNRHQGIPVDGYSEMFRRMFDRPNITVLLNTEFRDIEDPGSYDRVFFTGPVDELMEFRLGVLPYRSERFEFETIDKEFYQDTAVVNYPSLDVAFTRIHEFKHYLDEESPVTVIAREYPEAFVPGKNEPYYPVPGKDNEALHAKYVELAKERYPNMVFLGRLGDYRYYNMDQAVARAMDVVHQYLGSEK